MKSKSLLVVSILLTSSFAPMAIAQSRCENIFVYRAAEDPLLKVDLLQLQASETKGLTKAQVEKLNEQSLKFEDVLSLDPTESGRLQSLPLLNMKQVIASVAKNPVVKASKNGDYSQDGVDIGYCFGRAAYIHLTLIKMGVDKSAIRKVWAVGPFKGGDKAWQFHVATAVRGPQGKWYALDDLFGGKPVEIKDWFAAWKDSSVKGDMRLYVTDAQKFSAEIGGYDRIQMGLVLPKEKDWYKGFFKDLMAWFSHGELKDVGLSRLSPTREQREMEQNNANTTLVLDPVVAAAEINPTQATATATAANNTPVVNVTTAVQAATAPVVTTVTAAVPPVQRPLENATSSFSRLQQLNNSMLQANYQLQRSARGSAVESQSRQAAAQASEQMQSLIQQTNLVDVPWRELNNQANSYSYDFQRSARGSVMEQAYLNISRNIYAKIADSLQRQATREGWNSTQLLAERDQLMYLFQRTSPNSAAEAAYLKAIHVSDAMAIAAYSKEILLLDHSNALTQMSNFDYQFQRSARNSPREKTYFALRGIASKQAVERYKVEAVNKTFEQMETEFLNNDYQYYRSSLGSNRASLYNELRTISFNVAIEKMKLKVQQLTPQERAQRKATYNYTYQRTSRLTLQSKYYAAIISML